MVCMEIIWNLHSVYQLTHCTVSTISISFSKEMEWCQVMCRNVAKVNWSGLRVFIQHITETDQLTDLIEFCMTGLDTRSLPSTHKRCETWTPQRCQWYCSLSVSTRLTTTSPTLHFFCMFFQLHFSWSRQIGPINRILRLNAHTKPGNWMTRRKWWRHLASTRLVAIP